MTDTRTAIVVGGGIAGPVTALALQRAGITATVYEAYDGTADGVGAMLSIAPNGRAALDVLDAGHVLDEIGTPMTAMLLRSWTGKVLAELGTPPGLPDQLLVQRADLYRALYDEAIGRGIAVEHGKRLVSLADDGSAVTARFADGTSATADILVGADGIRSTTRGLIDRGAPAPRYGGLLNFGALVPDAGESTGGKMHMVFGKRAFCGYLVYEGGLGGWFVNLPRDTPLSLAEQRAVPNRVWLERLRAAFAGDRTLAPDLIGRTDPDDLLVVGPVEDLPTVPTWHRGRVVLVGDAAHATSPSSGQGASLAMESAVQLGRCLRDLPPQRAFTAYERLRRSRVERIIAAGARTNSNKAAGPVARVLRDLVLPVAMRSFAKPEKMAWQYGYRIDWDASAA
ncbi:FAD-dependent oxidoreductase [Actinocatenispora thailandica]|uniref:FAD-dependent oxidoreductase n=1 Tax=Actinocatenispora thailandica TaxID=227318 RepID=A0A7R7DQ65_9ACTN|nr:NAD(P)/FAD-dependent oxidoreductase [Actinocatenispora thailandica]BCJ35874.1 FAD-dependent oxidoreductase [Actinocatenispora thailandica]